MHNTYARTLAAVVAILIVSPAHGDQEASNLPQVTASRYGLFYAKSVPAGPWGQSGSTSIFRVEAYDDVKLHSYPWFAREIYLQGFAGSNTVSVVRMGPWARGRAPQPDHLAFELYKGNVLIRSVSTTDLVDLGAIARRSVSHYTVINRVVGIRRPWGNKLVFEVIVAGDRLLTFDLDTGEVLTPERLALETELDRARSAISSLKSRWWSSRQEVEGIREHLVTEEDLLSVGPLPELPPGYAYVPGRWWDAVRIEPIPPPATAGTPLRR